MVQFSILSGIKSDTGTKRTSLSDEEKKRIEDDIIARTSAPAKKAPSIEAPVFSTKPTAPKSPEVAKFEQNMQNQEIIRGLKAKDETLTTPKAPEPTPVEAANRVPTFSETALKNRQAAEGARGWVQKNVPVIGRLLFGDPLYSKAEKEMPPIFETKPGEWEFGPLGTGDKKAINLIVDTIRFLAKTPEDIYNKGIAGYFPTMTRTIADEIDKKYTILVDAGTDKKRAMNIASRWVSGSPQTDINPTERDLLKNEDTKQNLMKGVEALQIVEPFARIPTGNVVEQIAKRSIALETMPEIRASIAQRFPELVGSRELDDIANIVAKGGTPTEVQSAIKPIVENAKTNGVTMAAAPETKALAVTVDRNGIPKVVEGVRDELHRTSIASEAQLTDDALSGRREYYRLSNPDIAAPEVRAGTVKRSLSPMDEVSVFKIGDAINDGDHVFLTRKQAEAVAKAGEEITQAAAKAQDLVRADTGKFIFAPERAMTGPKLPPLNLEEQAAIRAERQVAEAQARTAAREAEKSRVAVEREARAFEKKMAADAKAAEKEAAQKVVQKERSLKFREDTANRIIKEAKAGLAEERATARAATKEAIARAKATYSSGGFPKEAVAESIAREKAYLAEELTGITDRFKATVAEQRGILKDIAMERTPPRVRATTAKTAPKAAEAGKVSPATAQAEKTALRGTQEAAATSEKAVPATEMAKEATVVPNNADGVVAQATEMTAGEGKQMKSRLSERMTDKFKKIEAEAEAARGGMDKTGRQLLDDTVATYNKMEIDGTLKKASEIVVRDPEAAINAVRTGAMIDGVHPEALYVALTEYAPMSKDMKFITDVTSLRATSAGQRLRLLAEIDRENPVRILQQIEDIRMKKVLARGEDVAGTTKEIVKKGAEELVTAEVKLNRAQELINSLICPE